MECQKSILSFIDRFIARHIGVRLHGSVALKTIIFVQVLAVPTLARLLIPTPEARDEFNRISKATERESKSVHASIEIEEAIGREIGVGRGSLATARGVSPRRVIISPANSFPTT